MTDPIDTEQRVMSGQAWEDFCDGLKEAGQLVFRDKAPANAFDRAEGYRYLMRTYDEGDRIYLLGFSRGAYTARALAALLQGFGLLAGDRENLVDYAVKYFWKGSDRGSDYFAIAGRFKKYFSVPVTVRFLEAVNGGDVRMLKRGQGPGFALETSHALGVRRKNRW